MAKRKRKSRKEELDQACRKQLIQEAAERCLEEKTKNNGRLPHKQMEKVLASIGDETLKKHHVDFRMRQLEKERASIAPSTPGNHPVAVSAPDDERTIISELTSPSVMSLSTAASSDSTRNRNLGGRPKNTDNFAKADEKKRLANAIKHGGYI